MSADRRSAPEPGETETAEPELKQAFSWSHAEGQRSFRQFSLAAEVGASFLSAPGERAENQDAWGYTEAADGGRVLILADGLGGHQGGLVAARSAVAGVAEAARRPEADSLSPASLQAMFESAQATVLRERERAPDLRAMRTTLLILVWRENRLLWGHVGDTRLYLFRQRRLWRRTLDHSVPQMLVEAGEIKPEEIRHHPDRNRLLQTVGDPEPGRLRPSLAEEKELRPGDFLVLATDGFWEWLNDDRLARLVAGPAGLARAMARAERELRAAAQASEPEYDNYSAAFLARAPVADEAGLWRRLGLVFKPRP